MPLLTELNAFCLIEAIKISLLRSWTKSGSPPQSLRRDKFLRLFLCFSFRQAKRAKVFR
jgi:hypothetical protein